MDTLYYIAFISIIFLAFIAALFSGAETALTGSSDARIHMLVKQKTKNADIVKDLKQNFSTISTIVVANQLINCFISTIMSWLIINLFGESTLLLLTAVTSLFFITYTEILPKILAVSYPESFLLKIAKFLRIVLFILRRVVALLESVAHFTLRILKIKHQSNISKTISDEEVRGVIDIHTAQTKSKHEKVMLNSILDLNDLEVSQIITPRQKIFKINSSLTLDKINEELLQSKYTRVPVWFQTPENIIGILHSKIFFKAYAKNKKFDISTILLKPWFIPETTKVITQLQAFKNKREHFALSVDEYGAITGILTLEDILEEIVGEILDENDEVSKDIEKQKDGSVIVDGSVPIRDINREFDLEIEEDATTIGGLIIYQERKIPKKGDIVKIKSDVSAEILKRKRNMIVSLRLFKTEDVGNSKDQNED